MFVQVIRSTVEDREAVHEALLRWQRDLSAGATGWLGSTAGVDDAGQFVLVARFASTEEARRNSDRPEQGQWWTETSKLFTGEVTFHDCEDVILQRGGGSDEAGFVQVIEGRALDPDRLRALDAEMDQDRSFRPDYLGGLVASHGDGHFTQVAYFPTEAEAREGERSEVPERMRPMMQELSSLLSDLTYLDLRDPWLMSARSAPQG